MIREEISSGTFLYKVILKYVTEVFLKSSMCIELTCSLNIPKYVSFRVF